MNNTNTSAPATDLHSVLHSAYTFVRSMETNSSIAALTLDHLLQDHINALKKGSTTVMSDATGTGIGSRKSRWDQLDELQSQFNSVISSLQNAGNDPEKLQALGVYEVDQET